VPLPIQTISAAWPSSARRSPCPITAGFMTVLPHAFQRLMAVVGGNRCCAYPERYGAYQNARQFR
jgi:hypothetical protein